MKSLYCNSKQVYSCVQLMHVSLRNGRCGPAEVKENKQQEKEQKFVWRTKTLEFSSVRVSVRSLSNHQTVPDTIKPPPHYVCVCVNAETFQSRVCVCVCVRARSHPCPPARLQSGGCVSIPEQHRCPCLSCCLWLSLTSSASPAGHRVKGQGSVSCPSRLHNSEKNCLVILLFTNCIVLIDHSCKNKDYCF